MAVKLVVAIPNYREAVSGRFLDCMVRKLMTYAVGRTLVTTPAAGSPMDDTAGLADIRTQLGSTDARLDRLIELIAASPAMTMRIGEESQ